MDSCVFVPALIEIKIPQLIFIFDETQKRFTMPEIEIPTEHLHEHIHEAAHEGKDKWSMLVAISTAFMAVFAALGGLMAGHHSNEALICQVKASDQWAYYQAKGIKAEVTNSILMLSADKESKDVEALKEKKGKYKEEQEGIKEKADELEKESAQHLHRDITLAQSVTFFQVAIAISAISILSKKRLLWYLALLLSIGGIFQFVMGLI